MGANPREPACNPPPGRKGTARAATPRNTMSTSNYSPNRFLTTLVFGRCSIFFVHESSRIPHEFIHKLSNNQQEEIHEIIYGYSCSAAGKIESPNERNHNQPFF